MKELYRSKYEAYPFLCDDYDDLRCDFEIFTDYISSEIGLLRALVNDEVIRDDLLKVCELVYHINPTLRTKKFTVTDDEVSWLEGKTLSLREECGERCKKFVVTQGSEAGCHAHLLRVMGKALTRLLYRYNMQGNEVDDKLFDFSNLLSGYFFHLALKINQIDGIDEIEYISRNYK